MEGNMCIFKAHLLEINLESFYIPHSKVLIKAWNMTMRWKSGLNPLYHLQINCLTCIRAYSIEKVTMLQKLPREIPKDI